MKTTFTRKPSCLTDALRDRDTLRGWHGGKDVNDYYVAAEKHLTAPEWSDFTNRFLVDRDWISDFSAREHENEGEAVACIRVTADDTEIALLIDPAGYGYARYVGIENASESASGLTPDENPKQTAAPVRGGSPTNTIVIKVWRGLVSEVYASDPNTQITIVDEDAGDEAPPHMPEHRVY